MSKKNALSLTQIKKKNNVLFILIKINLILNLNSLLSSLE